MSKFPYDALMDSVKELNDIFHRLYRLKITSAGEINAFFKEIDNNFGDCLKSDLLQAISSALRANNRYIMTYLTLMQKFYQKYPDLNSQHDSSLGEHILQKYFGITVTKPYQFKISNLLKSIIYDDVKLLAPFTEQNEYSHLQEIDFSYFPCVKNKLNLLETCCYYGSVNCFKFLRSKFSSGVTKVCLQLSFLGGNPDIMSECLKYQKPNEKCMKYAIMSHNVDFVTYLMNEHNIPIDINMCIYYDNIQAFLIHFDQSNDMERFIIGTIDLLLCYPRFNLSVITKIVFSLLPKIMDKKYQGLLNSAKAILFNEFDDVDFNFIDDYVKTFLHYVAEYFHWSNNVVLYYNEESILNNQDNEGKTALHYATISDNIDFLDQLKFYEINTETQDNEGKTALHYAVMNDNEYFTKRLLNFNDKSTEISDNDGKLPLHYAVIGGNVKIALAVIERTSRIRKRDNNSKFPLQYAVDDPEMFENLIYDPKT
ncbi:hypothetical protein TVAG_081820 [Trichomonas vaginalis G3]|uniref:DUF3447 domain-containing protein n=1 Tax=Trichomonas vaginalis (strain ATCC PRA-98 / G3) TaxID=412133 RepID=A2E6X4_TRIV3|nr:proteasome regulatory particle assembly [Trichomonas vaginalis G3]EAY11610.1 hypothetical protein TVAG_081820 [Trichomonas vaginalis G3]KAI5516508.1 proteasome regulatory particle assembly [Trichomonas vaginalis G3]|eukprot:XP_001323833.1 hypothetical protein [Trichomonas vaginalis G3]